MIFQHQQLNFIKLPTSYFKFVKFFFIILLNFFYKFNKGFLLKKFSLYIYIDFIYLNLLTSFLKYSTIFSVSSLMDLFAVDFPTKFDKRFELNYCFLSHFFCFRFFIKTFCSVASRVVSISKLYPSSNWFEREVWDMFGIKFALHKNLKRILTDYSFHGHPLRKDFPVWGFVDLRYDDVIFGVTSEIEELAQFYKYHFVFEGGWTKRYKLDYDILPIASV